jgi:uncharacterized lipoprotein
MNRTTPMLAALLAAVLAGCASSSPTPDYDQRFGDAVREARARQTLNPDAAAAPVVYGLDGKSARDAMVLYGKTFQSPPPVVNVINIGGAIAGQ